MTSATDSGGEETVRPRPAALVLETNRLRLRELTTADAPFMLRLLNEPSFIRNIADRGVRDLAAARGYILRVPVAAYEQFGFGLWLVELKETGEAAGVCGLVRREALEDVDLGYALLPEFWSRGYAREAAAAVTDYARDRLNLRRLLAIVSPHNEPSIRLLEKLGFAFARMIQLPGDEEEIKLFARDL